MKQRNFVLDRVFCLVESPLQESKADMAFTLEFVFHYFCQVWHGDSHQTRLLLLLLLLFSDSIIKSHNIATKNIVYFLTYMMIL